MIARDPQRLARLEAEIPGTVAKPCDVTDTRALQDILDEIGTPRVVVHNAVGGSFAPFQEVDPAVLQRNFEVNTMALLHIAQRVGPAMAEAGEGSIIVTGNTSAIRGKPNFAGFAPTKAAQRILAEPLARYTSHQRSISSISPVSGSFSV